MKTMRKTSVTILFFSFLVITSAHAEKGLDSFLHDLNIKAQADIGAFTVKLSADFGIPIPKVEGLLKIVDQPADAYMVLKVGQVAKQPEEKVIEEYRANKGKGWGVIAKNLGIKPGSKEFHELKSGDTGYSSGESRGKGKGKGHKN